MAEQKAKIKSSGFNFFQNPLSYAIKKHIFEIIQGKYAANESAIEKLATQVLTEQHYEEVGKLIAAIYESGYLKAVKDHQERLEALGIKANIVSSPVSQKENTLFPQEKSG